MSVTTLLIIIFVGSFVTSLITALIVDYFQGFYVWSYDREFIGVSRLGRHRIYLPIHIRHLLP